MKRLLLLLIASLILAWMIQKRDTSKTLIYGRPVKEKALTVCLVVLLGFFCGLRIWGNDTVTYLQVYDSIPTWKEFWDSFDLKFSDGIGFLVLTCIMKTLGLTSQDYLLSYAFITVLCYVLFIRRFSDDLVFSVFLMFATGMYTFSMAAIKQTTATAICLCALPMALDQKWIRFTLLIFLGSLFHPYALVYFVVPLMMFEPFTEWTYLYVILFVSIGFMLEGLIGTVLDVTAMMGADYSAEEMLGEGVNIFRVMVCFVPLGLAIFFGKALFDGGTKASFLMFNLAMVNALIMFVGLFGTANYFARLANFFLPAQAVTLPWMINSAHIHDRRSLLPLCYAGYFGYFYYENMIIRPFDTSYTQISLWNYLNDLIARYLL